MINILHKESNGISAARDALRVKLELVEPTPLRLAAEHAVAQAEAVAKHAESLAMQATEHAVALTVLTAQAVEIAELAAEQAAALSVADADCAVGLVSHKAAALASITAEIEALSLKRAAAFERLTAELVEVQTGLVEVYLEHKYLRIKDSQQVDSVARLSRKERLI